MDVDSICIRANDCPIPKTEHDITDEWIKKAVGVKPLANSTSVVGNIQDGVGFLSNLCRVVFQTEKGDQNILVKLLPVSPEYRALTLDGNFDEREIQYYEFVKPKILEIAPDLSENMCKVYCGKISKGNAVDHASMLVMEDLKPLGYQMYSSTRDQWKADLEKTLKFLAKFHGASIQLEQRLSTPLPKLFPFSMGTRQADFDALLDLALINITRLDALLKENNCASEIRAAYMEVKENASEYFNRILKEGEKHACLIHGDVWPPNILVNEDVKYPVKIIDWQCLAYKDPAAELAVVILTCLPKAQLNRNNIDSFCQLYMDTCSASGISGGRKKEEFKQWFDSWGIAYGFFWFLLSFDSYPDDMNRLFVSFEFLQKEYNVADILKQK